MIQKIEVARKISLDYQHLCCYDEYMTTYKTLAEARAAATEKDRAIAEIMHASEGRCFVRIGCSLETLRLVLRRKPMPEIVKLISEHEAIPYTPPATCPCEGCGREIERTTATYRNGTYRMRGSVIKTSDPYCQECIRKMDMDKD